MPLQEFLLADTPETLEHALAMLRSLRVVGVDVERADWNRYYRAAALVQVGGEGLVAIVDPLALGRLDPLQAFLAERLVVLHAMENDLGPLATLGVCPVRIEDTSIAAALLGLATGLEGLLRDVLGVVPHGDKATMQRAAWEDRPLRHDMLRYAAGDVADLPELWRVLEERLLATERMSWYRQELAAALAQPSVEARRDWTRTKGAGRLNAAAKARLRALWDAREKIARETNTAPARIAGDRVLVDLAITPPAKLPELGRRGVRRAAVRDFGQRLLDAIASGEHAAVASLPSRNGRRGRAAFEDDRAKADRLRAIRSEHARRLGLDPGVLCPSRTLLTALLSDPASPDELRVALGLRAWQWQQLGAAFCEALSLDGSGDPGTTGSTRGEETRMADLLNPDALHHALDRLEGWSGTGEGIAKSYEFRDFAEALAFVNRVGELAEDMNHHPDIEIRWNKVRLGLVTHSAGGVTQADLDLAARIEGLSTA
jgi:ribonuclease D